MTVLVAAGCGDPTTATVDTSVGTEAMPLTFVVSADAVELPPELEDTSTNPFTVAEVPCDATCPETEDVTVTCEAEFCDPDPVTVSVQVGDVYDLERTQSSLQLGEVDSFEILSIDYTVVENTLNMDVPSLQAFWSSAGAVEGETPLGTVDPIPEGELPAGTVALDEAGAEAMSDYLLNQEAKVRFFVQTELDLDPGDPWPTGKLDVDVIIHVRIHGSLI
ncbi:MAG: hypothetical protein ACOCXM_05500 [Myxococcota bacterium]